MEGECFVVGVVWCIELVDVVGWDVEGDGGFGYYLCVVGVIFVGVIGEDE